MVIIFTANSSTAQCGTDSGCISSSSSSIISSREDCRGSWTHWVLMDERAICLNCFQGHSSSPHRGITRVAMEGGLVRFSACPLRCCSGDAAIYAIYSRYIYDLQ